jgi:hypothetical protein
VVTPDPDLEPYLADAMSDLEEDDADKEPSLGWSANVAQLALHSCPIDGENEPDDALAGETAMADLLPAPASFAVSLTCP